MTSCTFLWYFHWYILHSRLMHCALIWPNSKAIQTSFSTWDQSQLDFWLGLYFFFSWCLPVAILHQWFNSDNKRCISDTCFIQFNLYYQDSQNTCKTFNLQDKTQSDTLTEQKNVGLWSRFLVGILSLIPCAWVLTIMIKKWYSAPYTVSLKFINSLSLLSLLIKKYSKAYTIYILSIRANIWNLIQVVLGVQINVLIQYLNSKIRFCEQPFQNGLTFHQLLKTEFIWNTFLDLYTNQ